ncbi:hypothetical protein NHQ30_005439 [Ciborinia camelliae]|nr:hypothetical protein NHQ30_005439 [Ciborinia camelliae]
MLCPEVFAHYTPLHCSLCGGESSTSPGKCKDPNASGWTCEFITIRGTATATSSTNSSVETVALVVFAGGVAWFLAGNNFAIMYRVQKIAPDDPQCPTPSKIARTVEVSTKCVLPLILAADARKKMTATNKQYIEIARARDKMLECPDLTKGMFLCIWCGGKTEEGKCKGDPDDDYEFAGYDCEDTPDWNQPPPLKVRLNAALNSQKLLNLPDIVYDPPALTSSAKPQPSCDPKESSGVPWNVFSPGVHTSFCENMGDNKTNQVGKVVDSKGNPIHIKTAKNHQFPTPLVYWAGRRRQIPIITRTIPSRSPGQMYHRMTESPCGHTGGEQESMASEAKIDTGCDIYSYSIIGTPSPIATSAPAPAPSPPPRLEKIISCTDHSNPDYLPFALKEATDYISKFCAADLSKPVADAYILKDVKLELTSLS